MSWISSLLGLDAQKKAGQAQDQQMALAQQTAKNQQGMYDTASPYYSSLLPYLAQRAGIGGGAGYGGLPGQTRTPGSGGPQRGFLPGVHLDRTNTTGAAGGSGYDPYQYLNQTQAALSQQALENANRDSSRLLASRQAQLGNAGSFGGSGYAGALSGIQSAQSGNLMKTLRDLAVQNEATRYGRETDALNALMSALNPGLSAGGAGIGAAQVMGQAAGQYGQQAQEGQNLIGGLLTNLVRQKAPNPYADPGLSGGGLSLTSLLPLFF